MKNLIYLMLLVSSISMNAQVGCGGYTEQTKSCGKCGGSVSINSRVGQRCPHCGVIWGAYRENTTYSRYSNHRRYRTNYTTRTKSYRRH